MTITFTIAGCTTDQPLEQDSIDASLNQPSDSISVDAPLKGSFNGEWYISANDQFKIKLSGMGAITFIRDDYDSDTQGAAVAFKSTDATFGISVISAKISELHNFDACSSAYEKAYGENTEGDCIRKRTEISVGGEKGITYLLGYASRGRQYVTRPCITSIFEKNGYFYQAIISSTLSYDPDSVSEQFKALERNMNILLNNIEFVK